jgi:hypothetical protein
MDLISALLVIGGLVAFEAISSIDNAIINAEVLTTMGQKARKWFLTWGLFIGVFVIRGLLPFLIVFALNPHLGVLGTLTATSSSDPKIHQAIEESSPILLMGGGVFLLQGKHK